MAAVDRSNQYFKVIDTSTDMLFSSSKGENSMTLFLPAGNYPKGAYKAFYDSIDGTTNIGDTASDQVDVPAFTIPAESVAQAGIKVAATTYHYSKSSDKKG